MNEDFKVSERNNNIRESSINISQNNDHMNNVELPRFQQQIEEENRVETLTKSLHQNSSVKDGQQFFENGDEITRTVQKQTETHPFSQGANNILNKLSLTPKPT